MAALSYANWVVLAKAAVKYLDYIEVAGATTSPSQVTNYDAVIAADLGDLSEDIANAMRAHRTIYSNGISPGVVQSLLMPIAREGALTIAAPEGASITFPRFMFRLNEYMVANSKTCNAREFTRGAISVGGSNVGNGTIRRLYVDHDGNALEGGSPEVKTILCRRDQLQVDVGEEEFEFSGALPKTDFLVVTGTGSQGSLKAVTTRATEQYLANPTFSQFSGTAPTAGVPTTATASDSFTGWVAGDYTKVQADLDSPYRDRVGVSQTYSCKFTGNTTMTQTFSAQKRPKFKERVPYYVQVAIYRKDAATGNVTIAIGGQSQVFALGSMSDNAWNVKSLDLDKDLYFKNFSTNAPTFVITVASLATGTCKVDDIIISEMQFVDGCWWLAVGGATPFKVADTFSFTDSVNATRGKFQYWWSYRSGYGSDAALAQTYGGFCLPSVTDASETITDP